MRYAEANINLLKVSLDHGILQLRGEASQTLDVEYLRPVREPTPLNLRMVPTIIVFEVVLLGFLIAAVMMFQEKQEGTLRAYRVTPSGAVNYILSKTVLFILLSLAYGIPILAASYLLMPAGSDPNFGLTLLLLVSIKRIHDPVQPGGGGLLTAACRSGSLWAWRC
jgi:hypothetical protein